MKAKIIFIAIVVVGIITACDVSDSNNTEEEFNPQVDGVWTFQEVVSIPCDDDPTICEQYHDIYYVFIDYPQIHACYERTSTADEIYIKTTKEDMEVAHINENIYRITTVNGDTVASDTLAFKMNIDEYGDLFIHEKEYDGGLVNEGLTYQSAGTSENNEAYQECRTNAKYSKGLVITW